MSDPRDRERELEEALDWFETKVHDAWNAFGTNPRHREKLAARARIVALFREARSSAVEDYLKDKDFIIGDLSGIEGLPNV